MRPRSIAVIEGHRPGALGDAVVWGVWALILFRNGMRRGGAQMPRKCLHRAPVVSPGVCIDRFPDLAEIEISSSAAASRVVLRNL